MIVAKQGSQRFAKRTGAEPVRRWAPRFWAGATLGTLLRLLHRNRWAVHPRLLFVLLLDLGIAASNSVAAFVENVAYARRIARVRLTAPPVFIVGHWRSGTTMLHELFALDPRNRCPTNFECFMANHFLVTGWAAGLYGLFMPTHRPMDRLPVEWDSPQEDEFALCLLGLRSPYETIAFPNHGPQASEYFALTDVPERARRRFEATLHRFLCRLTLRRPGRPVLKSPAHSFRVALLRSLYPDARFIHVVRHPLDVFPSTLNLWRRLYARHGFQRPSVDWLDEFVLSTFEEMQEALRSARSEVPDRRWTVVRYEDLVHDPVAVLTDVYDTLELGPLDDVIPDVRAYVEARSSMPRGTYDLSPTQREAVRTRWDRFAREHGYHFN